jgi:hypothetical protein
MNSTRVCTTCFYADFEDTKKPCLGCSGFNKWVDRDTFAEPKITSVSGVVQGQGVKFDQGKPQWSLMPWKALSQVVDVLTYGAKKYSPDNWKKVPNARQRYIDAGFRHVTAYALGEKNDSETGKNHLAHAICCFLYLIAFDLEEKQ